LVSSFLNELLKRIKLNNISLSVVFSRGIICKTLAFYLEKKYNTKNIKKYNEERKKRKETSLKTSYKFNLK
jgi:hypothetical protein